MFANWQLVVISLSYIGLLFVIAYLGDKHRHRLDKRWQPMIYALTLGVYCTSWSFLGTTGQASSNFLSHLPIYLGPIILFIFAWSFIQRIIRVSLKLNLTSIADLLAARFGKSHKLAILITIVALIGTLPYMALQLKAIVYSFTQLQVEKNIIPWRFGLLASVVLAGFTIIFGIRHLDVTERHPGVMLAIAFESLVKIIAFLMVGLFVTFFLYDSPMTLWRSTGANLHLETQLQWPNLTTMLAMIVITMAAFLSLPRQFQVMVVELKHPADMKLSRKIFPFYLLVFAIFAIPLGLAGQELLGGQVPTDTYVLYLPEYGGQRWLTLLAFLGAISAASSMVIISAIALSTMLSNEIVFPLLYRLKRKREVEFDRFRVRLLNIRKVLVSLVILLGYFVFLLASPDTLSSLGEIAFGAFAQLTPALIVAFYWRRASLTGVYAGILVGFSLWLFLSFLPQFGLYVKPFMDTFLPANTAATLVSLTANAFVIYLISQISRQSVQERVQASLFLEWRAPDLSGGLKKRVINPKELELLVSGFVGEEKARTSFITFSKNNSRKKLGLGLYNQHLLEHTEKTLASVMGASSARLVLSSALEGRDIALNELAMLVEETSSQQLRFSQNLLHSAIENASEGISIIDNDLNLVAWNKRYLELFNYPKELIYVGSPIESLIRFNVERGLCGDGEVELEVAKRIEYLRLGSPHESERQHHDGKAIRIEGNPLPDGGFVMLFSDITVYRQAEQVLKEENVDLEALVKERTEKLELANRELGLARIKAEQAHVKKSLYLKACSHDLMQPLEAARLFAEALSNQNNLTDTQHRQVDNIGHSLKVASDLLADLGEIARIESGNIVPQFEAFALQELLHSIANEFSASATHSQVEFRIISTHYWVYSDKQLLRRMVQNLVANAFRYASPGKVLLGARRSGQQLELVVLDNGPGIAKDKQAMVFEQFTQLTSEQKISTKGLGLGLNITKSLSEILHHKISLWSEENQGCKFSITLDIVDAVKKTNTAPNLSLHALAGITVLCIDDDEDVLSGMVELLATWECEVLAADSYKSALQMFEQHQDVIDIVLADYQLSPTENGLDLIEQLRSQCSHYLPAILITATTEMNIEQKASNANVGFMRKLVKPAALRALMSAQLTKKLESNYFE